MTWPIQVDQAEHQRTINFLLNPSGALVPVQSVGIWAPTGTILIKRNKKTVRTVWVRYLSHPAREILQIGVEAYVVLTLRPEDFYSLRIRQEGNVDYDMNGTAE